MKTHFTTGLAILLPLLLTILIVSFLINFLTAPFLESTKTLLNNLGLFNNQFLFFSPSVLTTVASKLLILIFLVGFIFLIGLAGQHFVIEYLFRLGDTFIHKVPIVNKIYKASQDTVNSLFSTSSKSFSQVVFAPYPRADLMCIGLTAGKPVKIALNDGVITDRVLVFVSGTPNPSAGFLLFYKDEDLIHVDMRVDQAMKSIVSCGVVMSDFTHSTPTFDKDEYTPQIS